MAPRPSEKATDREQTIENRKTAKAKLLARRRKAESESAPPVVFLLPFPLSALLERLPTVRLTPEHDRVAFADELVPVYVDGTAGDQKLYPISEPF